MLELHAFNVEGGLQKSSLIKSHLIDHFIPFLPLEVRHIEKCIQTEFENRGKFVGVSLIRYVFNIKTQLYNIIFFFVYYREIAKNDVVYKNNIFASTGCKRLNMKVGMYAWDM